MTRVFGRFVAGVLLALGSGAVAFAQQGGRMAAGCPLADPRAFHACALGRMKTFVPPRTPEGVPDMQGYWDRAYMSQDIEEHAANAFNIQAGPSLILDTPDRKIPYQPWAMAVRKGIVDRFISPLAACLAGAPRYALSPGPQEILQRPGYVVHLLEFSHAHRVIPTSAQPHLGSAIKLHVGDSRGRWEGNTLVVDVTNSSGLTWIDNAGNFFSDRLHAVERYTMIDADTIHFEARMEDPQVYTQPWTFVSALVRNKEPGFQLYEQACHEGNRSVEGSESIGMRRFPGVVPPGR
jgi:hypothetical protein